MTETVKHTPGPWEVFTAKDEPQMGNFHSAIYGPAGEYDGLFVALANQNGRYEADALLIAAAPELLEVVKAFVAETIDYATINKLGDAEQQHNVKWARSVISKAEGRQP